MSFLCECRGPCRRTINLTHETYSRLKAMGAVMTPECAEREARHVLYDHEGVAMVGRTWGRPGRPSAAFAIKR